MFWRGGLIMIDLFATGFTTTLFRACVVAHLSSRIQPVYLMSAFLRSPQFFELHLSTAGSSQLIEVVDEHEGDILVDEPAKVRCCLVIFAHSSLTSTR